MNWFGDEPHVHYGRDRLRFVAANRGIGVENADHAGDGQRTLPALPLGAKFGERVGHRVVVLAVVLAEPEFD